MALQAAGEVELRTAALRAGHNEQVRETIGVKPQKRADAAFLPLLPQRLAITANNHIEATCCHPLKASRVNQDVEWIFNAVMHHAVFRNLLHAQRRGVDQVHVWQVEGWQVFVMEG